MQDFAIALTLAGAIGFIVALIAVAFPFKWVLTSRKRVAKGLLYAVGLVILGTAIGINTLPEGSTPAPVANVREQPAHQAPGEALADLEKQFQSARDTLLATASPCMRGADIFVAASQKIERNEGTFAEFRDAAQSAADACDMAVSSMRMLKQNIPIKQPDKRQIWASIIDICADAMLAGHDLFAKAAQVTHTGYIKDSNSGNDSAGKVRECTNSVNRFRDNLEFSNPQFDALAAFRADWIPPAPGTGNFEICISNEALEDATAEITIPPNVIFASWGMMGGDLRSNDKKDLRALTNDNADDPEIRDLTAYAVITTLPVTLSKKRQCAITTVRAATHEGFGWHHDSISAARHFRFAPWPSVVRGRTVFGQQWGESTSNDPNAPSYGGLAGEFIGSEGSALNGTLLKDAGNPIHLLSPL